MKISIITTTYNSSLTIVDTLESVSRQSFRNFEHIIIDGLSSDDTLKKVAKFDHVAMCLSEKDEGIYDAMNKGIRLATGDVIGILNSDDFYASEKVLSKVHEMFEQRNCDVVYGDLEYVDCDDITKVKRYWKAGKYRSDGFKFGWMPPHPTFFVKREVYEKYGYFSLEMGTSADYEIMLRFIHKYKVIVDYIPKVLVKMRTGGASNSTLLARIKANRSDKRAWEVNGVEPFWFTLYLKPLLKIRQYFLVRRH